MIGRSPAYQPGTSIRRYNLLTFHHLPVYDGPSPMCHQDEVLLIDVPAYGSTGCQEPRPTPTREAGIQYTGGSGGNGLDPSVNNMRIMDPTSQYPNGYVNYGKTLPNGIWLHS
jgi:hypothetical protein